MATPDSQLGLVLPVLKPLPTTDSLDDAFCRMLAFVATAPVRPSTQGGDGAINPDGLDLAGLRRLAGRWCGRMKREQRFETGEIQGLEMVLQDSTDGEFLEMTRDAILTHMP